MIHHTEGVPAGTELFDRAFRTWRPDAVVFDCDGLLMDTEPCWTVAETAIFARRGLPFGPEQKALVIGKSVADAGAAMATAFGETGNAANLAEELYSLVVEIVGSTAEAMTGAHAIVDLAARAVPVAVASNSPRRLLDVALARGGFTDAFAVSVAADEVTSPKPAPDLYLVACERLGVLPDRALAFEDSITGLRSARAAAVPVIGVPTLAHQELPADVVVSSLTDPGLNEWIKGWLGESP
ncbi:MULTISPECIES: HAD family phosphatase [Actinoplanes]|uniref:HAD family hydrolase n=1 Tax=Actinoplanes TaxID=1865 RepID=UPI000AD3E426|nr:MULTISPECIES: HAD family phosphatase [Actinoplanes]GLY02651.1 haloacid dehalogenase [Actinoplanes sp. NBRC 101535]